MPEQDQSSTLSGSVLNPKILAQNANALTQNANALTQNASALTQNAGVLVQYAGAALSLALLAGVAVWGYKLVLRDATGIPVVQAMAGPMGQAPVNPGGEISDNIGFSVNDVIAQGAAAEAEDRLALAPEIVQLTEEDMLHVSNAEADERRPTAAEAAQAGLTTAAAQSGQVVPVSAEISAELTQALASGPLSEADVLALADQIAAGTVPLTDLAAEPVSADAVNAAVATAATTGPVLIAAHIAGVSRALRPPARPADLVFRASSDVDAAVAGAVAEAVAPQAPATPVPVSSEALPLGTVLVQFGAYDSAALAAGEWESISNEFAELMGGRDRLIELARSGGRDFYRLRALGFADLADARRFCSALVAEDADCIPYVVR
ncbi:MAG: SPOR domain-containing protein [Rhodobacteraceae bacterium]|nr:SPOR domain-containing protein [Paracoccaceae bacterium]